MRKKGLTLPIIIIFVLIFVGTTGALIYFLKVKNISKTLPGPSPRLFSTPSPSVEEQETEKYPLASPYLSNETPDREIEVVAGSLNFIDFTLNIIKMTNPRISIDQGKQAWMFLQTQTPSKKTNVFSFDTNFHSLLAFAPPKNISGRYDVKVNFYDNVEMKDSFLIRVNVLSNAKSRNISLPPKNIKAALIGIGFEQSIQDNVSSLESAYYEATGRQGRMQVTYLGNAPNSEAEVWAKTDEIIDSFIKSKGGSAANYDLALVQFKGNSYGGAPRTDTELKKIIFCCQNTVFLHEFIHLATGIGDINHENTLLPPDPLHYSSFELSQFFSNPTLLQLGFSPQKNGLWVLVDEWAYKKIGKPETYRIVIRNTGLKKNTVGLNVETLNSELKVNNTPSSWISLSERQFTLESGDEKSLKLVLNPSSFNGNLYGLTITATSELDQSVWDKANIYFETSR